MGNMIVAQQVTKEYRIYHSPAAKYFDFFFSTNHGDRFCALRDVSFGVKKGESVGLLGLNGDFIVITGTNGSGKSTLSNIIAGSLEPSAGTLTVNGSVSMTSVSGGLVTELTGLENIVQQGLLLGLSHKQIKEMTPGIIEFADIGPFIDQQVKTYSSGMRSRLAFSINVNIDPDIMVIDEALSVGDPTFTDKCLRKMREFRENGKTIVFVSHSLPQIRDFCDRAIWLEAGQLKMDGTAADVVGEYSEFISYYNRLNPQKKKEVIRRMRAAQMNRQGYDEGTSSLTGYSEYQKEQAERGNVEREQPSRDLSFARENIEVRAEGSRLVMRNTFPGGDELSFAWYVLAHTGEKYALTGYSERRQYETSFSSSATGVFSIKAYVMDDEGNRFSGIFWTVTVQNGLIIRIDPR